MTSEWLLSNGFRHNRIFSNEDTEVFTYRFPVYKCEGFVILECELRVVLGEDRVFVDVYDRNSINRYAPFYYSGYGNYTKMLDDIWLKINTNLKRLKIKQLKDMGDNNEGKNKKNKRKRNDANEGEPGSGR